MINHFRNDSALCNLQKGCRISMNVDFTLGMFLLHVKYNRFGRVSNHFRNVSVPCNLQVWQDFLSINDDHLPQECFYSMLFYKRSLSLVLLFEQVKLANGEEHFLVGSLDLNQGLRLPGEIIGNQPEVGSPFLARTPSLSPSASSRATQVTPCFTLPRIQSQFSQVDLQH